MSAIRLSHVSYPHQAQQFGVLGAQAAQRVAAEALQQADEGFGLNQLARLVDGTSIGIDSSGNGSPAGDG
jgi:hypothetical protein